MKISDITTLGRTPIDPSYPTNRAIAALALVPTVTGAISRLLSGAALLESVLINPAFGVCYFDESSLFINIRPFQLEKFRSTHPGIKNHLH